MFSPKYPIVILGCVIGLVISSPQLMATTYYFADYPSDENGHSISGSITTDGRPGNISWLDILGATLSIDGNAALSGTAIDPVIPGNEAPTGSMVATATQLSIALDGLAQFQFTNGASIEYDNNVTLVTMPPSYCNCYACSVGTASLWDDGSVSDSPRITLGQIGAAGWVIATASPVPEPSTLVLLGFGAVSLFAYAWRRRKQATV